MLLHPLANWSQVYKKEGQRGHNMPRCTDNYEPLADRADAILIDLLAAFGSLLNQGADSNRTRLALNLQVALNAQLRAEGAGDESTYVRVGAAGPVSSQGVFLRVMLEVIANGMKVGVWTVDYDGKGHLMRCPPGYIQGKMSHRGEGGQA